VKIAIVHDYGPAEWPGGADLTLKRLVFTAPREIHCELVWLTFRDSLQLNYFDRFIIANCRTVSPLQLGRSLEGKRYVKIHFDYGFVHPLVAQNANLLVYMSPKQRDDMVGKFTRAHVMPSLVDPNLFYPGDEPGEGHLWLSGYSRQKGPRSLWEWSEENEIHVDVYGYGVPKVYLKQSRYCHIKGVVPYKKIPKLLRQYRSLVHLPKGNEAGSRVFIEAILSGLSVITTPFEGDLSFDEPYNAQKWQERIRKAPQEFWRIVLQVLL